MQVQQFVIGPQLPTFRRAGKITPTPAVHSGLNPKTYFVIESEVERLLVADRLQALQTHKSRNYCPACWSRHVPSMQHLSWIEVVASACCSSSSKRSTCFA